MDETIVWNETIRQNDWHDFLDADDDMCIVTGCIVENRYTYKWIMQIKQFGENKN